MNKVRKKYYILSGNFWSEKSNKEETITEEYVMKVAENPVEYSLFSDFLGFLSLVLNLPNLLLLIYLQAWEVFVWRCRHKVENVFFLRNGINMLKNLFGELW